MIRTYSELIRFPTFEERFEYLQLRGVVGADTFGFDRVFNQMFYRSAEWQRVRSFVITRDNGCDLGCADRVIIGERILVHHMNPISLSDIQNATEYLMDPEYLITTVLLTHNGIHYGNSDILPRKPAERYRNDMCPWRK